MKRTCILLLPTLALIVILWLPFGFHMGALIEEWGLLGLYVRYGPIFVAGPHSILASHQMRPIMTTLWAIAYQVDPNSWWFWHVELALTLLIKGASMTWLALYLTGSRRWAVVAGLLFVVWPADTLQMAFRAMNVGLAAGLAPMAAALFIAAYLSKTAARRIGLALAGAACILAGTWTYELTLALAPLPFLVMYARDGACSTWATARRGIAVSAVWVVTVTICVGYIVFVLLTAQQTYQQSLAGSEGHLASVLRENAPMLFTRGFVRALADGWVDAARIVFRDLGAPVYLVAVAVLAWLLIWGIDRREIVVIDQGRLLRTFLVGLVCIAISYAPFLVSLSHLSITQRTFLFAASGAALVFLVGLLALQRFGRFLAVAVAVALLVFGTGQQLWQFKEYTANFELQRQALRSIEEQAPNVPEGKTLVVLDASQRLNDTYMLNVQGNLITALTYLYAKPAPSVQVCFTPIGLWAQRDPWGREGACAETEDAWIFRSPIPLNQSGVPALPRAADIKILKSNAVVVRIEPDGSAPESQEVKANRAALSKDLNVQAQRYRRAFGPDEWPRWLRFVGRDFDGASYRWDFGRRWNVAQPTAGAGWAEQAWSYAPFRQKSTVWIMSPKASLVFPLEPVNRDYVLMIRAAEPFAIAPKVSIKVNGVSSPVIVAAEDLLARVPRGALRGGMNTITIETPLGPAWGISMQIDKISLSPAS